MMFRIAAWLAAALVPSGAWASSGDADAVKAVVQTAYVEGVHSRLDPAAMRRGFHPDFRMLVLREGALQAVSLEEWIERLGRRAPAPGGARPSIEADFSALDVTGNAAAVRLELRRDGKHVFTDYLSLYRFADGWRIVSKTFQGHD
jgi:hypothetical protein